MAGDPTVAEFRARFGEFSATEDAVVTTVITGSTSIYGFNDEIRLLLVAHLLTLEHERQTTPDGGSGVVTRERIGQRDVFYNGSVGDIPLDDAFFQRSSYGRMYQTMVKRSPTYVLGMMNV